MTGRRRSSAAALARLVPALLLAAVALGGCGVGTDGEPRAIGAGDVPFGLLERPTSTLTTTTVAGRAVPITVSVYMLRQGRVVAVKRDLAGALALRPVLELLLAGPTESEARDGLLTAISPTTELLSVTIDGSVARVNLSASFGESGVQDQTAAVAQIVFTAAGLPAVSGVTFSLAGRPVEVPAADGTLRRGTLTPADYAALASG